MSKRAWLGWIAGIAVCSALGCSDDPPDTLLGRSGSAAAGGFAGSGGVPGSAGLGGFGVAGTPPIAGGPTDPQAVFDFGASCDPELEVRSIEPALIVRDPAVLEVFTLERVLTQIIASAKAQAIVTPLELLQRLFDTENATAGAVFSENVHCDSEDNAAFQHAPPTYCPRAEGQLAASTGLLEPEHPDSFEPIALINRLDLLPSDASTCGEYRVVFAKRSGRTDAANRVLLSFDAPLANPSHRFSACRPLVELWAGLEELDTDAQRAQLERLYFAGMDPLPAVLTAQSLSAFGGRCEDVGRCGQVRVAQGMEEPFEYRQFRAVTTWSLEQATELWFTPVTNDDSMRPELFDLAPENTQGTTLRYALALNADRLGAADLNRISLSSTSAFEAGETAVEGPASPNYAERVSAGTEAQIAAFDDELLPAIARINAACPAEAPLSPLSLVQRTAALGCAGCHAPTRVLGPERELGCGDVWPESLGVTHLDESGALSPALTDVFLPYRKRALTLLLQACDAPAAHELLHTVTLR